MNYLKSRVSNPGMLKKPWYRVALRFALNELGIPPTELNPAFRDEIVEMGLREHLTPKEAALAVLSMVYPRLSFVDRLSTLPVVRKWRRSPKVREFNYQRALAGGFPDTRSPAFRD